MILITGDTHGIFDRVGKLCDRIGTIKDDVLIILGDAGINFYGHELDLSKKQYLDYCPITIFAIHGNHEQRPETIPSYKTKKWNGGTVYYEEEYPHILFAKDGEIYDLDGRKTLVIGGAYSIDKAYRVQRGFGWWADEQPSNETKAYVEAQLEKQGWKVDVVLSHTVPLKYEPMESFMHGVDQEKVDKSTERWLDSIEDRLEYKKWYCGHYHIEKKIDSITFMFENIQELCEFEFEQ